MIHKEASRRGFDEIDQALRDSAARHKFGIITVHDLQQTLKNKGVELDKRCLVYEVCNPHQAKKVLDGDGSLSAALPCRISVYDTSGGSRELATILPTAMIGMFGQPALAEVAREVEDVVVAMMKESA